MKSGSCGKVGFRARRYDICNRLSDAFIYRGCQEGVDVALVWPAEHDCHASDLSAVVNLGRESRIQVGIARKQLVEVGHDAVLPDPGMGPVELGGVPVASHDLALVVVAEGCAAKVSRQKAEDSECAILP